MKITCRLNTILIMLAIFCAMLFFVNLPHNAKIYASGLSDFEKFSAEVMEMIRQNDSQNQAVVFNKSQDLKKVNNSFIVEAKNFATKTNSKYIFDSESNSITIKNNSKNIEFNLKDNYAIIDNEQLYSNTNFFDYNNETLSLNMQAMADNLDFELKENEDNVILSRPYIPTRLIVSSNENIKTYGAIAHAQGYKNLHILQYENNKKMMQAYGKIKNNTNINYVCIDEEVKATELEEQNSFNSKNAVVERAYKTWGADLLGVNGYSNYLLTTYNNEENLQDVIIAVLDTGIDVNHPWFANRIAQGGKNYSNYNNSIAEYEDINEYQDVNGHGTHVSGIICDITLPNVKILPIKVLGDNGSGDISQIILGINYVTELKNGGENIVAMNMSFGGGSIKGDGAHKLYSEAITKAYNSNILSIVASGNEANDASRSAPSNVDCAITVGSLENIANIRFRRSYFSNYGTQVDVCAPGSNIFSARVGGGTISKSGTSMAAPHISGLVGLLTSDVNKNYQLSDIENILTQKAIDFGEKGKDIYFGMGASTLKYMHTNTLTPVEFSQKETTCTQAFNLTLSHPDPNAIILYTLDGSLPLVEKQDIKLSLEENPNVKKYTSPILVDKTMQIHAFALIMENSSIVSASAMNSIIYRFGDTDIENPFIINDKGIVLDYHGVLENVVIPQIIKASFADNPSNILDITIKNINVGAFASGVIKSVKLPSSMTSIASNAFLGCEYLTSVTAPNVTAIEESAFENCENYTTLDETHFPKLTTIENKAFKNTNLNNIIHSGIEIIKDSAFIQEYRYPTNLKSINFSNCSYIEDYAFSNSKYLSSIDLPKVESICNMTFYNCDLQNVVLPNVKYIGNEAFNFNENLTKIDCPNAEIIGYQAFSNLPELTTTNIPNIKYVGVEAFKNCNKLNNVAMDKVENIGTLAFYDCALENIKLDRVKRIGLQSFAGNLILSVDLPNVEYIEKLAFENNPNLAKITLSNNIQYIASDAFTNISSDALFNIYSGTYAEEFVKKQNFNYVDLSLDTVFNYKIVDNQVYIIGLKSTQTQIISIPSQLNNLPITRICANAFSGNENIEFLSMHYLEIIEENAFNGAINLKFIDLPSILEIKANAFNGCAKLDNLNLYDIRNVGKFAFLGCPNLNQVVFTNQVQTLGEKAFGYDTLSQKNEKFEIIGFLKTEAENYATVNKIPFKFASHSFAGYYQIGVLSGEEVVIIASVNNYESGNIIIPQIIENKQVVAIADNALNGCAFIKSVVLPSSVTLIGQSAFKNCESLESINLDNVVAVGVNCFANCSSLKNVGTINMKIIPSDAFKSCFSLKKLVLPNINTINEYAFKDCINLREVVSPNVTKIKKGGFSGCVELQKIDLSKINELGTLYEDDTMAGEVFFGCDKIIEVYLPSLISMENANFTSNLQKIALGKNWKRNGHEEIISKNTVIYGYEGSEAQTYANEKGNTFVAIDEFQMTKNLDATATTTHNANFNLSVEVKGLNVQYEWYEIDLKNTHHKLNGEIKSSFKVPTTTIGKKKYYVKALNWDGAVLTSNTCEVTVKLNNYTITASVSANGSISENGVINVIEGTNKTFKFKPNTGYKVAKIIIDSVELNKVDVENAVKNGYTFTNITSDHTISVEFAIATFIITASAGANGKISNAEAFYDYGSYAIFTFTPQKNYSVSKIVVDNVKLVGNDFTNAVKNGYAFNNITSDHTISVEFAVPTFTIKVEQPKNILITKPQDFYNYGDNAQFYFKVKTGYKLSAIIVDGIAISKENFEDAVKNGYLFENIISNHTLSVEYECEKFAVIIKNDKNGSITPNVSDPSKILFGQAVTFKITPKNGYEVSKVYVNGIEVFVDNNLLKINKMTHDLEIKVVYQAQNNTIIGVISNTALIIIISGIVVLLGGIIALIIYLKRKKQLKDN